MLRHRDETYKIYREIIDKYQVNDRREYDEDQLETMYGLGKEGSKHLWLLIQSVTNDDYVIGNKDPVKVTECLAEAVHEGLEGWSDPDKAVILAFLADTALAAKLSAE